MVAGTLGEHALVDSNSMQARIKTLFKTIAIPLFIYILNKTKSAPGWFR
jgi:hypothetical protein